MLMLHANHVRTTLEGGSYREQGRSRSFKKRFFHVAISFSTTDVPLGKDEYCTGERARPVRTTSLAGAHALVLFMLTAYLHPSHRSKVPKQQAQKAQVALAEVVTKPKAVPTKRKKTRRGPARLTKKRPTAEDLDEEMDAYRASVPHIGGDHSKMVFT